MKLIDLLEKDKNDLITELGAAKEADKAVRILENKLDELLLVYNEQCEGDNERSAAAYMMQAIRFSLPMIDSVGETKVWETGGGVIKQKSGIRPIAIIFIAAALVLCILGLLPPIQSLYGAGKDVDFIRMAAFEAGALAAAFFAGFFSRRPPQKEAQKTQHVETHVDAEKIYRTFRNAILSVDRNLEEIRAMERWGQREEAGLIDGNEPTDSELDLFSDLLAASYSGDPEYALEKIAEIKFWLHKQQIEVVDYSEADARFFDMMPGQFAQTIRPALVADGTLLKKGIASSGAVQEDR